jgi:hypothetical protein
MENFIGLSSRESFEPTVFLRAPSRIEGRRRIESIFVR